MMTPLKASNHQDQDVRGLNANPILSAAGFNKWDWEPTEKVGFSMYIKSHGLGGLT